MRTTKNDIFRLGEEIAEILNKKNNTNIYSFDYPWGVVKKSECGGISVVFYANDCTRANYEKLMAIREVLYEI